MIRLEVGLQSKDCIIVLSTTTGGHAVAHYVDTVLEKLRELGHTAKKLGIEKVAEVAGIKPRMVKKFTVDPMTCNNADIRKITDAVKELTKDKPE